MIRLRVRHEHVVKPESQWQFHEWWLDGATARADRLGRGNPRMIVARWLVASCLNPDCPAEAIINQDDLLGMFPPAPQSKPVGVAP